jgi:hypothetical protein
MKALRQIRLIIGTFLISSILTQLPAKAEWGFDPEYIGSKFQTFLRSTIEEAEVKDAPFPIGQQLSQLRSECSSLTIVGLPTWDEGSPGYEKAYYIWFPNGINAVCWEFIKQAIPSTPFNLVKGVNQSVINKVVYVPFSDPGPSVFFYFGKEPKK